MENLYLSLINYGWIGIALAALSEAIFLPLPMETISIPIYLLNTDKAFSFSLVLVFFSVAGSAAGYLIGCRFGAPLLKRFAPQKTISKIEELYAKNAFLTLMTSAFSPIAYEAYVLSAGAFRVNFKEFIAASFISRCIRHIPQGILIYFFGDIFISHLKKYFLWISVLVFSILILKYLQVHMKRLIQK